MFPLFPYAQCGPGEPLSSASAPPRSSGCVEQRAGRGINVACWDQTKQNLKIWGKHGKTGKLRFPQIVSLSISDLPPRPVHSEDLDRAEAVERDTPGEDPGFATP